MIIIRQITQLNLSYHRSRGFRSLSEESTGNGPLVEKIRRRVMHLSDSITTN
jgi:hypothetical protein